MKRAISLGDALSKALERYANEPQEIDELYEQRIRESFQGHFPYGNCPICHGAGWFTYDVPIDDPRFGKPQKCTNPGCSKANQLADQRLVNYDLPASYRRLTFESFAALPEHYREGKMAAFHAAVMFATDPFQNVGLRQACERKLPGWSKMSDTLKNSIVFYGPMGNGKTGLVAAIMNAMSRQGVTGILYRRTSDLLQDLMDGFNDREKAADAREKSFTQRIAQYQKASILILDEWNIVNPSAFKLQSMEDILRYRHGNLLPTLMTTNLTKEQSYQEWGERTADVVAEMAHFVPMDGKKLRQVE